MMTKDERIRFYKSKEWQITRKRVLERDNYECQQCKRDGKLTTYDKSKRKSLDVDHILSLEHHPEFAHDLNNLETLSTPLTIFLNVLYLLSLNFFIAHRSIGLPGKLLLPAPALSGS
ncbi:HNH endonuclease [Staphylococcus aureus]|uniref:HNH endonuclease n=1 Tax=Staphylococcus aureus TaxID=1280 RepID=UPI00283AA5B8|nr:HNH endonuclease [Staphylococcus aureus]